MNRRIDRRAEHRSDDNTRSVSIADLSMAAWDAVGLTALLASLSHRLTLDDDAPGCLAWHAQTYHANPRLKGRARNARPLKDARHCP